MRFLFLVPAALIALAASSAPAATLLAYGITGTTSAQSFAPTAVDASLTATSFATGSNGYIYTSGTDPSRYLAVESTQVESQTPSVSTVLADASYFSFTFTPAAGEALSLTSLTFDARPSSTNRPSFFVFSSATGFTSADVLTDSPSSLSLNFNSGAFTTYTVDLTGASFQNLTTATTFRIYMQSTSAVSSIYFDNFALNGAANAVPEPAAWMLGLLGGAAALGRRFVRRILSVVRGKAGARLVSSLALGIALAALSTSPAGAATLLAYGITGTTTAQSLAPTSVDVSLTATSISGGTGATIYTAGTDPSRYLADQPNTPESVTPSADAVLADASYFSFTLTPVAGEALSLTSLTFDARATGTSRPSFFVFSSATGFSSANVLAGTPSSLNLNYGTGSFSTFTFGLTGAAFQNLTTATTFRIYIQNTQTVSGIYFDNFALNGTANAVPEPSVWALGLLGALAATGRRLFRHARLDPVPVRR